jgi:cysteine-rich repeat protein
MPVSHPSRLHGAPLVALGILAALAGCVRLSSRDETPDASTATDAPAPTDAPRRPDVAERTDAPPAPDTPDAPEADARICTPGEARCVDGSTTEVCAPDGLSYGAATDCGTASSCDPTDGACRPWVCTPGTPSCLDSGAVHICSADGFGHDAPMDCGDARGCDPADGMCRAWVCVPGASACLGSASVQVCSADGLAYGPASPCGGGESCDAGTCAVRCGDGVVGGVETCDDGNTASGDGCSSVCEYESCGYASFDGTGLLSASSFNLPDAAHTVEAWIRLDATADRPIISIGRLSFTARATQRDLVVQYTAHNSWYITSRASPLVLGAWHHVAYTYNGTGYATAGSMTLFVDGVPYAMTFEGNTARNPLPTSGGTVIGREVTESSPAYRFFHGDMAMLRVSDGRRYTVPFTPSRTYASDASTRAYWPLDDGMGTLADDITGTNDATLSGGVTWGADACALSCGDGTVDAGETCDDGNTASGDGCSSTCVGEYEALVRSLGAAAYWPLHETGGTTITDVLGGRVGTLTGGSAVQDTPGLHPMSSNAAGFTGAGYFVVPADPALWTASFSVEAWLRVDNCDVSSPGSFYVMKFGEGYQGWGVWVSNGEVAFEIASTTGFGWNTVRFGCVAGSTEHLVGTYEAGTMRLYRNGTLVGSTPMTTPVAATARMGIGARAESSPATFLGALDDVALYPRALSAAEVATHYAAR